MGDATAVKAKQYPNIKFAIIDNAYFPTKGVAYCDDTKKDCYADGGLTNVTSLMFQEDQVGFLAGVLAGGMTKTGTVCTVSGMEIPPVVRFVVGFQNGAKYAKADAKTLNVYIPSFTDPAKGKETGQSMISQGCDVVFGVGGNTGNGGLLAAKEKGLDGDWCGRGSIQHLSRSQKCAHLQRGEERRYGCLHLSQIRQRQVVQSRHVHRESPERRRRSCALPRLGQQDPPSGKRQNQNCQRRFKERQARDWLQVIVPQRS